jgi:hypothetical protein
MLTLVPSGLRGTYTTREDDGNTRIPSAATERYEAGRWRKPTREGVELRGSITSGTASVQRQHTTNITHVWVLRYR